jgi:hypothetical protein
MWCRFEHLSFSLSTMVFRQWYRTRYSRKLVSGTAADCAKAREAKSLAAKSRAADLVPVVEDIRTAGAASLRSIAKELNERGISAPRGGVWSAAQVRAAMARIPASRRESERAS